ncbi:FG-GAP repeat-containing protein [Cyclobacterium xiamenense]|uniref:FG-GAP repeat-containing protein n=1 Tax=Cyclobacterium xiamenense TaxID=1297121 RepID=A0A1H6XHI7_9BACT|nr:VCBS repeat-containing protein [Cyclobacterium xiamenense]SEJ28543.1 FG-GAP repeat-containing protein [Cyclobacterium xiamenense]
MTKRFRFLYGGLLILASVSCTNEDPNAVFTELPSSKTGITFKNLVRESDAFNVLTYGYFYQGGGVAVGDINGDSLPDIYFTGNMMASKLYLNKGDFSFEDITESAGVAAAGLWNTGTTMADVNGDGLLDIYICRSAANDPNNRRNLLFINQGDLTFLEQGAAYGLDDPGYATQASFFDYDNDGDLDLFLLNHSTQEYAGFSRIDGSFKRKTGNFLGDKLYRNDSGIFVDVSRESGIIGNVLGFGLAVTVTDFNDDGWLDIYVSNDYNEEDYLYVNQQDGTFKESVREYMGHVSLFSMGADAADMNNDLLPDFLTMDMMPEFNFTQKSILGPENYDKYRELLAKGFHAQTMRNMFHLNHGAGKFVEIGQYAGIAHTDWSWAVLAADFDNDGWKDIFVSNGYARNYLDMDFLNYMVSERMKSNQSEKEEALIDLIDKMPPIYVQNYLYHNQGDLSFVNKASEWGLQRETVSNAAAYADLDGDGDLDLIVCHTNEPVSIYRNNSERLFDRAFLKVRLQGSGQNTSGIGAKVRVYGEAKHWQQELIPTRGYQSSVDHELVFGLGSIERIDSLEVFWPGGDYQVLQDLSINQTLYLDQRNVGDQPPVGSETKSLFVPVEDALGLDFTHRESPFLDFIQDRLMPNTMSALGPKLTVGDVTGDGLEDLYVGGGTDQPGQLYVQLPNGSFRNVPQPAFEEDRAPVDTDAAFIDVTGNGHLDLYVVSGGNDYPAGDERYLDRLYLNDGKGNFVRSTAALPDMRVSGSIVQVGDLDNDGLADLFVGGRYVPGSFPRAPRSYVLRNAADGTFVDMTERFCADLLHPGLISDAQLLDLNGDNLLDLVLVGEWMSPQVYLNQGGSSMERKEDAIPEGLSGWWKHLSVADLDADGDLDLIVGNQGENNPFGSSEDQPMRLVFKDFDGNGSVDPLFTYYMADTNAFAFSRDEFLGQLPSFKGVFSDYRSFAKTPVGEFFTSEQIQGADTLLTTTLQSGYFENDGNAAFRFVPFPREAQFAPMYATELMDINGDGYLDLLTGGNLTKTRVSFGQQDANNGYVLLGDGMGGFKTADPAVTGVFIRGDVRDIQLLRIQGDPYVVYSLNNGNVQVYSF